MAQVNRVLNVGVIGPGEIAGQRLVPALNTLRGARFFSVLGRDADRTLAFAQTHNATARQAAHTDLSTFLSDPKLDAVIVASPDKLHVTHCLAAVKAGKHVFVEKPIATCSRDASRISRACSRAEVHLAVGYHLRFHRAHQMVSKLINQGAIGDVRHVDVRWTMLSQPTDWRANPATGRWWSMAALGTHCLDLVNWLVEPSSGHIVRSQCLSTNKLFKGNDETCSVNLEFKSGATANIVVSVTFRAARYIEIFGTAGSIRCNDTLGPRGAGALFVNGRPVDFEVVDPYREELADFVRAIRGNTRGAAVDGPEATRQMLLLERLLP
jgi:predicted dehydrogenase